MSIDAEVTGNLDPGTASMPPSGRLRNHLIKGATGSFVLQVGFAGFAFFNALVLARVLGAGGYGAFANAMAWVSLLTIPATFGFGILVVRDTAIYRSQGKWALLKGLLRFADRFVLMLSVALAIVAAGVAGWMFSSPSQAMMRHTVWIALLLLPLFALYNLQEAATRGLEYVIRARLPGMIVRPGLLLCGIVTLYFLWPGHLSAPVAMGVNVFAGIVALGLGFVFLRQLLPAEAKISTPKYTPRPWLKAAFPMLIYGGAQIVLGQTDIVMLGVMRGPREVGLYAAAHRLALLLVYVTIANETILAPIVSRLHAIDEIDRLQKIITKIVRLSSLIVFPIGLLFIFGGAKILIIFGHEFLAAKIALAILSCGRLLDVALGSGGLILSMLKHEHIVAIVFTITAVINIIFNALLIPHYGVEGAALASAIGLTSAKLLLRHYAREKVDLDTTILGSLKK